MRRQSLDTVDTQPEFTALLALLADIMDGSGLVEKRDAPFWVRDYFLPKLFARGWTLARMPEYEAVCQEVDAYFQGSKQSTHLTDMVTSSPDGDGRNQDPL